MKLFAIPPHAPFLDALAAAWLAEQGSADESLAQGLILLPTRRAARALVEAFLRAAEGRALLLPRITAIGALDETPLALNGALELPPAVAPARRLAELTRLILALKGEFGSPESADGAWALARELAVMMDEAEREEIDLAARLPEAVSGDYADHWQVTLKFLRIVTEAWPRWLEEQRLMNPAARQMALLRAAASVWRACPPSYPIWAAGIISGLPAITELLRTIAELPKGRVILPGFDSTLSDALELPETHPEALVRRMFALLGAKPDAVRPWPHPLPASMAPKERASMLWRALRPAEALAEWQDPLAHAPQGLSLLKPQDEQEEAVAIALILRDALEQPGARAALVTPDRALAARVSAELLRFGILADDSAGEALADTPPAVFLRLLAEAVAAELAPVPLLGLLKHPFTAAGLAPAEARAAARRLELACLRGRAPEPGLRGLRYAIQSAPEGERQVCEAFLARLENALAPLLRVFAASSAAPYAMLAALIKAGEALAATDAEHGAVRLWSAEEGEALAAHLSELLAALPRLPDQSPAVLPGLFRAVLEGAVVRTRRALRGRQGMEHPRVFIWGLLEAQLQSADVMVLGGLVEGVWPPLTDPGPWLSRPMRKAVGLPSPELAIGQAARDFLWAANAAPRVVFSASRRRDRAPAVPSRWLVRLEAMLNGQGAALPEHPAVAWARALDQPEGGKARPAPRPLPCPPLAARPKRLAVTDIETLLSDPYAIYARYVLRLKPLDPLELDLTALDYGILVHAAMERFLEKWGAEWPDDAEAELRNAMLTELQQRRLRPALAAWWAPRLERIAKWLAEFESGRLKELGPPQKLKAEASGCWELPEFALSGRADRLELRADGALYIVDYKTGTVPDQKSVEEGRKPQLPLLACMARAGAFGPEFQTSRIGGLAYWRVTGEEPAGKEQRLFDGDSERLAAVLAKAEQGLRRLIDRFLNPEECYPAQPGPGGRRLRGFPDYAQLARVAEWAGAEEA